MITNEKKYDITKMVTISTAHIKESTTSFLEETLLFPVYQFYYFDYFYIIWIEDDTESYLKPFKNAIPNDLWACIMFAHNLGCQWLCLDGDGEIVDELPVYEWKN